VSPRVREESVHPRLQLGACVRPLNFTVRLHEDPTLRLGLVCGPLRREALVRPILCPEWSP